MNDLPPPDSNELKSLITGNVGRVIYEVLYNNRDTPLSMSDIREYVEPKLGFQEHLNRRLRDLDRVVFIKRVRSGIHTSYQLQGKLEKPHNTLTINKADRAWVLRDQRCAQCGRTPTEDKVRLHVDHKIPQEWGGTNDRENLQALCSECNEGKKNLYATYDTFADKIKLAANYDEPHKRIGELLKAFKGKPVPSELLEVVAKAKQYQDDWQKRMRELRTLGWEFTVSKKRQEDRVQSFYSLTKYEPWPEGNIRAAIKKQELRRKQE